MTFFRVPHDDPGFGERPQKPISESDLALSRANETATRNPFLLRSIVDFVALSMANRPFDELLAQYLTLVRPLGFAYVALMDIAGPGANPISGVCFTTFPAEFVARFAKNARWQNDPVWKAAEGAKRPFRWAEVAEQADPEAQANVLYRNEGLADGLTIPISAPNLKRAVMFLGAVRPLDLDDTIEELLKVASDVLAARAPLMDDRVKTPQRLTGRERQVLTRTAHGRSAREIGIDLEMSEKTVARHLLNVRTKLGAANSVQAVVIALRQNQIHL